MSRTVGYVILIMLGVFAHVSQGVADQIVGDDLIVQGSQCVGIDCVNNEAFTGEALRLKENNLRIRLHDTSAPDGLGQSWNLSANNFTNGGKSYFLFEQKSLTQDGLRLSDGSAPLFDCTATTASPAILPPIVGVIPYGEPVLFPQNPTFDGIAIAWQCLTVVDFTVKPVLILGAAAGDNNATLGYDSRPESGVVSVGDAGLLRNLTHVAAGLAATDVLITGTLNGYTPFQDQRAQLTALQQSVADLSTQIAAIEDKVYNNSAPTAPVLVSPQINASGLTTTVDLKWTPSTDADGDTIRYSVTVCENQDFSGCAPEVVAPVSPSMIFAGLGSGAGILLLFGAGIPQLRSRRRRWVYAACLLSTAMLVAACSSGGSGNAGENLPTLSHTLTGLNPGTKYYWRVTATDFIDSSSSGVGNFTTQ